jgi:hypothetical protein
MAENKPKPKGTRITREVRDAEGNILAVEDDISARQRVDAADNIVTEVTDMHTETLTDAPGPGKPEDLATRLPPLRGAPQVFAQSPVAGSGEPIAVSARLGRTSLVSTCDAPLWWAIEQTTNWLSFNNYAGFIDFVLCGEELPEETPDGSDPMAAALRSYFEHARKGYSSLRKRRYLPYTDTDAYRLLKVATEAYVSASCGVLPLDDQGGKGYKQWWKDRSLVGVYSDKDIVYDLDHLSTCWVDNYLEKMNGTRSRALPYLAIIRRKLSDAPIIANIFPQHDEDGLGEQERLCYGILQDKLTNPCFLELIWSYWQEQGMLVQTMNAMSRRFQNIRGPADRDPLAMLELDYLRPLNNLLWGYVQDEQHRLTVLRRAYEYDHHYGLTLEGKAVPALRTVDSRSKFLDSFHNLLYLCSVFYKQDDDTTVVSDAFPILIALQDVHMLLTEGAHNQFGDLPSTARIEMLMQQWLLARPELREVLPTRIMVDYPEPWMDRVDAMKRLQGWPGANVMHFNFLAHYGEQILLGIRFADWNDADRDQAKVWARYFRSAIQFYIQSYRIVTGVDLTADVSQPQQRSMIATQPSTLLRQRALGSQAEQHPALPAPGATTPKALPQSAPATSQFRQRRAKRAA